ncbi:hypothetical protein [Enterococcus raffinosus]|uniref:hypothetical protein n=1 Tax=Enterococcus TaxID=1350 RepID=UPI001C496C3A|nr:hypothetical protein [Enterococcus raffinosus]MDT2572895.1 hypothetical protein [Enterococcus raffinosus]QXJ59329.1 hypothetical protein J9537_00640 [Enterococcus raffinosus]
MKNQRKDHNAEKRFVKDHFFEKGHWGNKFYIGILTIIGWIAVGIPVYWTLSSTLLKNNSQVYHVWKDRTGEAVYYHTGFQFLVSLGILSIGLFFLVLRNNHRIKYHERVEKLYDDEGLRIRKMALNTFYSERFGSEETRHESRYYSVPEEKNLADATIRELYKEAERHGS